MEAMQKGEMFEEYWERQCKKCGQCCYFKGKPCIYLKGKDKYGKRECKDYWHRFTLKFRKKLGYKCFPILAVAGTDEGLPKGCGYQQIVDDFKEMDKINKEMAKRENE
jgi:uncharacterized cysteine cluster protein YcgN (CxxCxxCC family)